MKKFYEITSHLFQPLVIPTYGILMLVNLNVFSFLSLRWRLVSVLGTLLFTGIFPAVPILLMYKRGEVHDVFISRREERTLPYVFSLVSYFFWVIFLWRVVRLPFFIVAIGIFITASIVAIVLINMRWKISAHLSGMGALSGGALGIAYRLGDNPVALILTLFFISSLVALARIELKAHTPAQTLGGYLLGFTAALLPCVLI
jgi:membrane-associated phospholipid phosphatase